MNALFFNKKIFLGLLFFLLALILFSALFFINKKSPKEIVSPIFKFVEEKISQSGFIKIRPPSGVALDYAKQNIIFDPPLKGIWIDQKVPLTSFLSYRAFAKENVPAENLLIFKPSQKLELNKRYAVALKLPDQSQIREEFLVVEDPKIEAIFPAQNTEASEYSEITIIFNRPMVPLTTLQELDQKDVPVEILPPTEGKFKWVSTRNLQFIPKNRLVRSSNYSVKIKDGLISMDGLEIKGMQSAFKSLPIRLLSEDTSNALIYNQPFILSFNQPIDLKKTRNEIKLIDSETKKEIPFIADFPPEEKITKPANFSQGLLSKILASAGTLLGITTQDKEKINEQRESILYIYPQQDSFGRKKLWDFNKTYEIKINKIYPKEGDIIISDPLSFTIITSDIIAFISADSERTEYAAQDFFDPKGKLIVKFYEDIDISKSAFRSAKPIKNIYYGKKCSNAEETTDLDDENCQRVDDQSLINIEFFEKDFSFSEKFEITFEKIINTNGLKVNASPIVQTITTYPKFEIFATNPANHQINSSLTELIICSSTPIWQPAKEDFEKVFKGSPEYQIKQWGRSYKNEEVNQEKECQPQEFITTISYGLMPLENYQFKIDLSDVFGQKEVLNLVFKTGNLESKELAFYHLQQQYSVTSPSKTALTFAVKNMEFVNLEICKMEPEQFVDYLQSDTNYDGQDSQIISGCAEKLNKKITLPKKYWINNYFKVDIKDYFPSKLGHYILTFTHPDYKITRGRWDNVLKKYITYKVFERSYVTVTNLAVAAKEISPIDYLFEGAEPLTEKELSEMKNLYWVSSMDSLENIAGARIDLYDESDEMVFSSETDFNGVALVKPLPNLRYAIIKHQNDSAIVFKNRSSLNWGSDAFRSKRIYLYSDKPIYQPGQTVYVKGIYRIGFETMYELPAIKNLKLELYDSRDNLILTKEVSTNNFGTFNAEFILDKKAPLGNYRICASDTFNCVYFDVEEYVGAPFEVKLKTNKEEFFSNDNLRLEINANYYFGLPLEEGKVELTLSSQNYYFDKFDGEFYYFGNYVPDYDNSEDYYYGDKFLLRDNFNLKENGRAIFDKKINLEELFKNRDERQSKIIVADVSVQNLQGQTVSSQKSFILHQGKFYLGLLPNKTFVGKDEPLEIKIKSVDAQGKNIAINNGVLTINKIDWLFAKRQEADGGYSYKIEKKKKEVSRHNFSTDGSGNYIFKNIKLENEGEYEIEVAAIDDLKNEIWSRAPLYVYGPSQASVKPFADTTLELETKNKNLKVGDKGEIIIKSPHLETKALVSIERGKIFKYEILTLKGNLNQYSFDVLDDYYPNVFVSVLLNSKAPDVKFGTIEFKVDNNNQKEIDIDVKSNKTYYLPGEKVALEISTKDKKGVPVKAELSLAVVDLSVLALKGNPKKNPLVFFYGGFPLTVRTLSNLKDILTPTEIAEETTKGGGGGDLSKKPRGKFKETAFWQADIVTNENGKAQVEFTLPDNLTTWQVETIGVTLDTKLGVAYSEFISKKDLMVIPLKPRFIVPGDVFYIGAKIFNQTKTIQQFKIELSSDTLELIEEQKLKQTTIPADGTDTIYFKVRAPENIENGFHHFTLKATGAAHEDAVTESINITPNNTFEATATSAYSSKPLEKEFIFIPEYINKNKGSLTINSSATLAVFLSPALNYLINFPYDCLEQIASNLSAIAKVKKALQVPNLAEKFKLSPVKYGDKEYTLDEVVEISLAKLLANQYPNGGFPFWHGQEPNFNVTLAVFEALFNLREAGYNVDENTLSQTARYLYSEFRAKDYLYTNPNTVITLSYLLSKLSNFSEGEILKQSTSQYLQNDLLLNQKLSNQALAYLNLALINWGYPPDQILKVSAILDNRVKIDARGAFIDINNNYLWYYFETPIKNTALYLKTLVARQKESPVLDKILRWLLNSRAKDGSWGSTNNTLYVIDALTDFLNWKKETQSNFDLKILLNNLEISQASFSPETILDQHKKELPISELSVNKNSSIEFKKLNKNNLENRFYYDIVLKYYLSAHNIPARDEGFTVERHYFAAQDKQNKTPITKAKVGDIIRVNLKIATAQTRRFVSIEDFIPAGAEIVNLDLATEQKSLRFLKKEEFDGRFYANFKEIRNDRAYYFVENLAPGVYEIEYFIRALTQGKFLALPTIVSETYFPENFGRTAVQYFEIE